MNRKNLKNLVLASILSLAAIAQADYVATDWISENGADFGVSGSWSEEVAHSAESGIAFAQDEDAAEVVFSANRAAAGDETLVTLNLNFPAADTLEQLAADGDTAKAGVTMVEDNGSFRFALFNAAAGEWVVSYRTFAALDTDYTVKVLLTESELTYSVLVGATEIELASFAAAGVAVERLRFSGNGTVASFSGTEFHVADADADFEATLGLDADGVIAAVNSESGAIELPENWTIAVNAAGVTELVRPNGEICGSFREYHNVTLAGRTLTITLNEKALGSLVTLDNSSKAAATGFKVNAAEDAADEFNAAITDSREGLWYGLEYCENLGSGFNAPATWTAGNGGAIVLSAPKCGASGFYRQVVRDAAPVAK